MAYNFIDCDRNQLFLLPPSMRDWLPEGHLVWFILDAVDQLDLSSVYRRYRSDGWGRAAYPPQMMVALSLYAYCTGIRSSRKIEQACQENVAFKVITGGAGSGPYHRLPVPPKVPGGAFGVVHGGVVAVWAGRAG